MGVSVLGNFFNNLAVAMRSRNLALNLFSGKRALVLDVIKGFFAGLSINLPNVLAFFQEDAVNPNL